MRKWKELKPQQVKKLTEGAAILAVVLVLFGYWLDLIFLAVPGLLLMIAAVVLNTVLYRCPACGKHLGRDGGDFCRHCGARLDQ